VGKHIIVLAGWLSVAVYPVQVANGEAKLIGSRQACVEYEASGEVSVEAKKRVTQYQRKRNITRQRD
jgi:hypothetical protein